MSSIRISGLLCIFGAAFIMNACQPSNEWNKEGDTLVQQATLLEKKHTILNARIDSLWDATSDALDKALPADFPPVDRDIFLNARNADHIRMFMSYKSISPELQSMVDRAGEYDQMLAQQIRDLQEDKQLFEHQKIEFLQKVAQQDAATSVAYAGRFRTVSGESNQ